MIAFDSVYGRQSSHYKRERELSSTDDIDPVSNNHPKVWFVHADYASR